MKTLVALSFFLLLSCNPNNDYWIEEQRRISIASTLRVSDGLPDEFKSYIADQNENFTKYYFRIQTGGSLIRPLYTDYYITLKQNVIIAIHTNRVQY